MSAAVREVAGAATALANSAASPSQQQWRRRGRGKGKISVSVSWLANLQQVQTLRCGSGSSSGRFKAEQNCGARCAVADKGSALVVEEEHKGATGVEQLVGEVMTWEGRARLQKVLELAARLPRLSASQRIAENRVLGCTAQVWVTAELGSDGRMRFGADSDAELTRGLCALLLEALDGAPPEAVLAVPDDALKGLSVGGAASASRSNTWFNVLITMKKRTLMALAQRAGLPAFERFPSLLITADDVTAQGDFAQAQVKYLSPDAARVHELVGLLKAKQIGIVAHFYMDPEVQGVLVAAQKEWPNIYISDSLVMADRAVKMAEAGCKNIAVLGVDFMSENVRAILDRAGHQQVGVYRMSGEHIGCSLAEAAQTPAYLQFLQAASTVKPSLHVIYINTSLETKAQAHSLVPTITCTSSNVVQTVLQAFSQVPGLTVWYGPDSYMGANLAELFRILCTLSDEEIAAVHPAHNRKTISEILSRLHYFQDGTCLVHDLFGKDVVARLRKGYPDAYQTAHFEVPGEMFALAMEAKARGMGVVGSTQNILDFITARLEEALERGFSDRLQFVLGTESGMITSIVGAVRQLLSANRHKNGQNIGVEIVFPVSSDAISTPSEGPTNGTFTSSNLAVVPGVASGEGCSITGGCASCPYMKMNSLDALLRVCQSLDTAAEPFVAPYRARTFQTPAEGLTTVAELGCEPILHMRHFQATGTLSKELVQHVIGSEPAASVLE